MLPSLALNMQKGTKMQVRLKVQRAHAAAVACLEYWQGELDKARADREAIIVRESAKLLTEKTWCGGFKYNEQSAREYFVNGRGVTAYVSWYCWTASSGLDAADRTIEYRQSIIDWLTRFIKNTQDKSGFMVILTEEQYGWIWTDV